MKPVFDSRLVLVGGGHTHVQVLRKLMMAPIDGLHTTVVVDTPIAVYSGMVPGYVAGQYRRDELEIDVRPLARRAGARIIVARASRIDRAGERIEIEGRPSIPFDVASFDIGSLVAGLDTPGVREHALPTRPIGQFVSRIDELVARRDYLTTRHRGLFRIAIVGAGAGGIELAFTLRQRLLASGSDPAIEMTLVHAADDILPTYPKRLALQIRREAERCGIEIRSGSRVEAVDATRLYLAGGDEQPSDAVVWVTGAAGHSVFADSNLTVDDSGFLPIRRTLQSAEFDRLFAVGDCATLTDFPATPKAGVYAVRQGPVLIHNLEAILANRPLRRYRPQRDFLTLLNLGDGRAIGSKWGLTACGTSLMKLKDHIDRKFMRRFQVLESDGRPTVHFPAVDSQMKMLCGGCASKIGQSALERALARLPALPHDPSVSLLADDAAIVELAGNTRLAATNDHFTAFTDDPYLVGQVAGVNALSDLVATGVRPRYALATVTVPEDLDENQAEEVLFQAMAGVRVTLDPLGVSLVGGHSTTATELSVGLSLLGIDNGEAPLLPLGSLRPGQALVLSKALGTGVLLRADMQGLATGRWMKVATASMLRTNIRAASIAVAAGARAATDITGFGLIGHLGNMLRASGCSARIELCSVPLLPGATELVRQGIRSTFHAENAKAKRGIVSRASDSARLELLFDPQTSGGLLFGVDPVKAWSVVARLRAHGDTHAAIIGRTISAGSDARPSPLIEVVDRELPSQIASSEAELIVRDELIPPEPGHAVSKGWTSATNFQPVGVTWHWTATHDLAECRELLGGSAPRRKGIASAHYAVGRNREEGVERYVSLENRSWHAGKHQLLRWDGEPLEGPELKASNTTIGVETVALGYSRPGVDSEHGWIAVDSPSGDLSFLVQPWTETQIELMIGVGKEIQQRWPHIGPRDHHGHVDICSGYKSDPLGFPYARVLRGIYDDPEIPDVWSPLWIQESRVRALSMLGFADLFTFQRATSLTANGLWTTFVCWKIWARFIEEGLDFEQISVR